MGKLNSELVSEKERLRKELEKARSESGTLRRKRVSSEKVSSYSDIMQQRWLMPTTSSLNTRVVIKFCILNLCPPHSSLRMDLKSRP